MVAFVLFDFFGTTTFENIKIWTKSNETKNVIYVKQESQKILKYLEDYTNIPHVLRKLDLVALPQCKTEATESWGLSTYK